MRLPNSGINWPTAGLALSYRKNPMPYYSGVGNKEKTWKKNTVRWDIYLFGMGNKASVTTAKNLYPIFGTGFQTSKQIGKINALTFGAEVFTDPARTQELKLKFNVDASPVRAGLMFGNEFLLGRFLFSQRIGVYIFNQTTYSEFFHRWGLLYRMSSHWAFGFSFLAHGKTADFFDAKLAYSWQKRGTKL
jgi:hypothetical protein